MSNDRNNLLIVDDDPITRERLVAYFEREDYKTNVAVDGTEMWHILASLPVDIVLLDIGLPGKDGLELARELRTHRENIGIILVTSRDDEIDKIVGLECGADDYVTKPFHTRELLARVKNLLRRSRHEEQTLVGNIYSFNGWEIDLPCRRLFAPEGTRVYLTDGEFDLLSMLVRNPGVVLNRDRLMQAVSHRIWNPTDRTIDVLIRRLRGKVESNPKLPEFITTVRGEGYVFTAKMD